VRMVDYDYLIDSVKKCPSLKGNIVFFKSLRTIDAVKVVRCEKCSHHTDEEIGMVYCPNIVGGWVSNDFYCKDGELCHKGIPWLVLHTPTLTDDAEAIWRCIMD